MDPAKNSPTPSYDLLLTVLEPPRGAAPRQWRFTAADTIHIGRTADSEVRIDDALVSRRHARVECRKRGWVCVNLGTNGTLVDGQKVSSVDVTSDTVIQLAPGGPRIQFALATPTPAPTPAEHAASVTQWLSELKDGEDAAAARLWDRYFQRVVRLARRRLGTAPRRVCDEEDVALSVFETLCCGVSEGRFGELASRDNLWRLLVVLTARKAVDQIHHDTRQKRGGGKVRGESVWRASAESDSLPPGLMQVVSDEPTPQFAALLAEEAQQLLDLLDDEESRQIVRRKMEGYTNVQIAEELSCTPRTIERKTRAIRERWSTFDAGCCVAE